VKSRWISLEHVAPQSLVTGHYGHYVIDIAGFIAARERDRLAYPRAVLGLLLVHPARSICGYNSAPTMPCYVRGCKERPQHRVIHRRFGLVDTCTDHDPTANPRRGGDATEMTAVDVDERGLVAQRCLLAAYKRLDSAYQLDRDALEYARLVYHGYFWGLVAVAAHRMPEAVAATIEEDEAGELRDARLDPEHSADLVASTIDLASTLWSGGFIPIDARPQLVKVGAALIADVRAPLDPDVIVNLVLLLEEAAD
jgi:hypothetical protein